MLINNYYPSLTLVYLRERDKDATHNVNGKKKKKTKSINLIMRK